MAPKQDLAELVHANPFPLTHRAGPPVENVFIRTDGKFDEFALDMVGQLNREGCIKGERTVPFEQFQKCEEASHTKISEKYGEGTPSNKKQTEFYDVMMVLCSSYQDKAIDPP
uniref:EIF_4G1 domain-containing protein n=1 Tax=Steinernema glaseri TaxID=37863 RepID=A0A1I8AMZ3_9BILA